MIKSSERKGWNDTVSVSVQSENGKKILLLGGSYQQIVAIEAAKRLGYYTILCDYLNDNPGQKYADKFYLVSTTDKEAVLEVAKKEKIDGVIAYASDPAAPTAAYVAEKLGLEGNPLKAVEICCNKDRFRKFLQENQFYTPKTKTYTSIEDAFKDVKRFQFPIIIKPVDSSGSKGVTVLYNENELERAFLYALSYSRCKKIIVEEYIEKKHPYLIGGDIFVVDGKIILWGLMNCHRDNRVNTLVPTGKSYPLFLDEKDVDNVKNTLSQLVTKLGIRNGAMNVELIINKKDHVIPIDIGPRCGGNMIPEVLSDIWEINIAEISIKAAMGDTIECKLKEPEYHYATYNLHSNRKGIYLDISFDKELEQYIYRKVLYKKCGDNVEYFDNATKCLGIIFMKFDNLDKMKKILSEMENHIFLDLDITENE